MQRPYVEQLSDTEYVSILTGPFRPVQRGRGQPHQYCTWCFNPHRPFQAGATYGRSKSRPQGESFNPHRPFQAGATYGYIRPTRLGSVSILTGPFRPVQHVITSSVITTIEVSILTGPFRPVQPCGLAGAYLCEFVSILTGPFRPVQRYPV